MDSMGYVSVRFVDIRHKKCSITVKILIGGFLETCSSKKRGVGFNDFRDGAGGVDLHVTRCIWKNCISDSEGVHSLLWIHTWKT